MQCICTVNFRNENCIDLPYSDVSRLKYQPWKSKQ